MSRITKFALLKIIIVKYSLSNLLLKFCCNYLIRKSRIASNLNLLLYLGCFWKKLFSLRVLILPLYDVAMVDQMFIFKIDLEHTFPSRLPT